MKEWMCLSLFICALLMACYAPRPDWSDKDVDFLIAKLKSWHPNTRSHATWYLNDKMEQRDRIIAALTHALLNDTHEKVRAHTAYALKRMTPPAVEALPALREASKLPEKDRGKPFSPLLEDFAPLPEQTEWALESITGAQKALEAIKQSGPPPIESSVPAGASDVDADFINKHGITLRLPPNGTHDMPEHGYCKILAPDLRTVWREWFTTMVRDIVVTLKPEADDPKLVNGTAYVLEVYGHFQSTPYLITTFTFTTKP